MGEMKMSLTVDNRNICPEDICHLLRDNVITAVIVLIFNFIDFIDSKEIKGRGM